MNRLGVPRYRRITSVILWPAMLYIMCVTCFWSLLHSLLTILNFLGREFGGHFQDVGTQVNGSWHFGTLAYGTLTNFITSFFIFYSSIATTSVYMHASKKNVSNFIDLTDVGTGVDHTIEYKRVIRIKKEKKKSKRTRKSKST